MCPKSGVVARWHSVATLYDLLDASPDATAEELRRAYHRAARLLHPDLNPDRDTSDAMRRLNDAWAVLGDPQRRRGYDARLAIPTPPASTPAPRPADDRPRFTADRQPARARVLVRLLRPSVVLITVLALIFVVTAYMGPHNGARTPNGSPSTTASAPAVTSATVADPAGPGLAAGSSMLVGRCILPLMGYDAVVPCDQAGSKLVVEAVSSGSSCPGGSTVYQLEGRQQLVCLEPASP